MTARWPARQFLELHWSPLIEAVTLEAAFREQVLFALLQHRTAMVTIPSPLGQIHRLAFAEGWWVGRRGLIAQGYGPSA